jgi:hypothetical protein
MKRLTIFILSMLFTANSFAESINKEIIIKIILNNKIITRDSGAPLSREFLIQCIHAKGNSQFVIDCDDIVFEHYITFFKDYKNRKVILITEDGASVENRWVFVEDKNNHFHITETLWPEISLITLSKLLINKTGDKKYTEEYINRFCHSPYRIKHPSKRNPNVDVLSGIPDSSEGLKLGEINWNGKIFNFVENKR